MTHEFDATLKKLEGKIQWTVFYVPFSVEQQYGTSGRLKVKARIDGHEFDGTLLPSRSGHYMVCNKRIRDRCNKDVGDSVHVILEHDTGPRPVVVPEPILEALRAHPAALQAFEQLPDYRKREEISKVMDAKQPATRDRRTKMLIEALSGETK